MQCEASKAEEIIRDTGKLVGHRLHVSRAIDVTGAAEISGNEIVLLPAAFAAQLSDAEVQLLEYLAKDPPGTGLICEPSLVAAVDRLVYTEPRLITDVYEVSGGRIARITEAGRAAAITGRQGL